MRDEKKAFPHAPLLDTCSIIAETLLARKSDNMKHVKYYLYARKSSEDVERQVKSIEAQIAELEEYAMRE